MTATFVVLDVGQGNCAIAVDDASSKAIVVDCAAGASSIAVDRLRELHASVDTVIVSHSHLDHLGGVLELASVVDVARIHYNHERCLSADRDRDKKLLALLRGLAQLRERGVQLGDARDDDGGQVGALSWHVLGPSKGGLTEAYVDGLPNAGCAVVMVQALGHRFLLSGDSTMALWEEMLAAGVDVSADIFVVPHHGGNFAPGQTVHALGQVLDAVAADYHVISVGSNNSYGHPLPDVLKALASRDRGPRLLCTQVNAWCLGDARPDEVRAHARRILPKTSDGAGIRGRGCPCAGSVVFLAELSGLTALPNAVEHGAVMATLGNALARA
jgi:competence protein ComEC